jgi:hypothetical protein
LNGRRQQLDRRQRAQQREAADAGERQPPAAGVREDAGQQPAGHPADRVAADVEPDREAERGAVDLLRQVRHRDRRQPRQRDPLQRPQDQQRGEARRGGAGEPEQRRGEQRPAHHARAAVGVGEPAGRHERQPERRRRHRQHERGGGRRDVEPLRQQRQQRLRREQQRERRQAGGEERDGGTPEAGLSSAMTGRFTHGDRR